MKSSRFSRSQNQSFKRSLFRLRKDRAPCCAFMAARTSCGELPEFADALAIIFWYNRPSNW